MPRAPLRDYRGGFTNGDFRHHAELPHGTAQSQSTASSLRSSSTFTLLLIVSLLAITLILLFGNQTPVEPTVHSDSLRQPTTIVRDRKDPLLVSTSHRMRMDTVKEIDSETQRGIDSTEINLDLNAERWNKLHAPKDRIKRIAVLIPFISPQDGAPTFPAYFEAFCVAASGSSSLVDFIIAHDGVPEHLQPSDLPSNVKLLNFGSTQNMARLFLRVLENELTSAEHEDLVGILSMQLHRYPYLLVEFKPALGHIFQDYLTGYSHWGYSDLDILFGDLPRWVTHDELHDFDVVTYGYGDQARLYIRGQFSFHRNDPSRINQLWRPCQYLSKMDVRIAKARSGEESLKFQSAEGCYSSKILQAKDINVKYVAKAMTDVTNDLSGITDITLLGDRYYSHGLYVGIGRMLGTRRIVVYRAASDGPNNGGKQLLKAPMDWFESDRIYNDTNVDLLVSAGEKIPLDNSGSYPHHCMYWVPKEYQAHICVDPSQVSSYDTIYLLEGRLYKQRQYRQSFWNGSIQTGPFFHFQEWKRYYRSSQLSTLKYNYIKSSQDDQLVVKGWVITKQGALPVYPDTAHHMDNALKDAKQELAGSTHYRGMQGVLHSHIVSHWRDGELSVERNRLPPSSQVYCLRSSRKVFPPKPQVSHCDDMVSWQDRERVLILNGASSWNDYGAAAADQITLVLTMEIPHHHLAIDAQDHTEELLKLAEDNVLSWDNSSSGRRQPCILLVHLRNQDDRQSTLKKIFQRFGSGTLNVINSQGNSSEQFKSSQETKHLSHCLVAVVLSDSSLPASPNALMNMAREAAPTRWVVFGLEPGMLISKEASLFAHRAVKVQGDVPGKVYVIPQFVASAPDDHLKQMSEVKNVHPTLLSAGILDFIQAHNEHKHSRFTGSYEEISCGGTSDSFSGDTQSEEGFHKQVDRLWWEMTAARIPSFGGKSKQEVNEELEWTQWMEKLRSFLIDLLMETNQKQLRSFVSSPLLLLDRIGPKKRMYTFDVVKEMEEFDGSGCYSFLTMAQLAALGYEIHVLPGAFAVSLSLLHKRRGNFAQGFQAERCRRVKLKDVEEDVGSSSDRINVGCSACCMITQHIEDEILSDERERIARMNLLWRDRESLQ